MNKKNKQGILERIFKFILLISIIILTVFFSIGFSEVIHQNLSAYIVVFYTLITAVTIKELIRLMKFILNELI